MERRLVHLVVGPQHRPRDVLEQQRHVGQHATHLRDVARDDPDRLAGARQLRQVTDVDATGAGERHVLGDHPGAQLARQCPETSRAVEVDAIGAAERQLHAMRHDGPDLGDRACLAPALTLRVAGLGDDLDEVDGGRRGDEIGGELGAKAEPDACLPQWTCHGRRIRPAT